MCTIPSLDHLTPKKAAHLPTTHQNSLIVWSTLQS
uniref:Uncharacterized protein n=1 Tax=Moniliophthora roreri TaxID=221103 RepID=A0A0W0G545_MONRR